MALVLVVIFALSFASMAFAEEDEIEEVPAEIEEMTQEPEEEPEEELPEEPVEETEPVEEPEQENTEVEEPEPEEKGELEGKTVILHTNDVHGAIDKYKYVAGLKNDFEAKGAEVVLVDAGDFSQGATYVNDSKGADAITIMNAVGYDVAAIGNHEFDYGVDTLKANVANGLFKTICANVFNENGSALFNENTLFETETGLKIGFFALVAPSTSTVANPMCTKGLSFAAGSDMYALAQKQANALDSADLVICLSHLGVDGSNLPDRSVDLYENVSGLDFIIDGHSHTVMVCGPQQEPIQSTGTKLAYAGVIIIDNETKTIEDNYLVEINDTTPSDNAVAAKAQEIIDRINAKYNVVFAQSEVELTGEKAPGNRTMETNNGDFIADAMLWAATEKDDTIDPESAVAIMNGGSIRDYIHKGDVTKKDINTVLPFGNTLTVIRVSGAELLEALEASTYCTPDSPVGGFPQVAGMKYEIASYKEYDAESEPYPGSTFYGPKTIQRVTIKEVNGKPFDMNAQYTVITTDFSAAGGDTYYAFARAEAKYDTGLLVDEMVVEYIIEELGGVIGSEYAEPQGRITYVAEKPADPEPTPTPAPDPDIPPTGDTSYIAVYSLLMLASALAAVSVKKKKVQD